MSYELIDPMINDWAKRHSLHVASSYQDSEVRSTTVVSSDGANKCQIWIDAPDDEGITNVHVWNFGKLRDDRRATVSNLADLLEIAYTLAVKWTT